MYVQVCTRPNISYVIGVLGRYQSNLCIEQWKVVKKVSCYLQGIKDYMLTYRRTNNLEIMNYSNSDYVGCKDTRMSTFDYVFMLFDGPISWKSHKQALVSSSTMEVEYIPCYEAMCHEIWLGNLGNFGSSLHVVDLNMRPLRIYCDNSVAV